jgi:heterodisulfide reductase subunit C
LDRKRNPFRAEARRRLFDNRFCFIVLLARNRRTDGDRGVFALSFVKFFTFSRPLAIPVLIPHNQAAGCRRLATEAACGLRFGASLPVGAATLECFALDGEKRMSSKVADGRRTFLDEVIEATPGGERMVHCLQCGSCGGSCPSGADMEYTPRALIAMINLGERDTVLAANTLWACVSCYFCTVRCPQEIPITEIIYSLKRIAIAEKCFQNTDAPALAQTFTGYVDKYGRSFEFGLATAYHLLNRPLETMKMGPMGVAMFSRGRMSLMPTKIKNLKQLQAIIQKARELGGSES